MIRLEGIPDNLNVANGRHLLNADRSVSLGSGLVLLENVTNGQVVLVTLQHAGEEYEANDVLELTEGSGTGATVTVTEVDDETGAIVDFSLTTEGSEYEAGDFPGSGGSGTGAAFTILVVTPLTGDLAIGGKHFLYGNRAVTLANGVLTITDVTKGIIGGLAIVAAGTGYAEDDILGMGGGNGQGQARVTEVDEETGEILAVTVETPGAEYETATYDTAGGTGTGARLSVTSASGVAGTVNVPKGGVSVKNDVEVTTQGQGYVLKSPNGTRYRLTVDNDGVVSAETV